jgi:hypothetical protein
MKKPLVLFILAAVAALLTGCDPAQDAWNWKVTNQTEQTLKFNFIGHRLPRSPAYGLYLPVKIPPGKTIVLFSGTTRTGKRHSWHFGEYFNHWAGSHGEDVYWQILSEDDVVLKTWNFSDYGKPDQRFFNESSWKYEEKPGERSLIVTSYSWTFDILPEDIQQEDQIIYQPLKKLTDHEKITCVHRPVRICVDRM